MMDIFTEIRKLDFPSDQYVVVGGGGLAARGIRETPDIDLMVTPELFEQCRKSGNWQEKNQHRQGLKQDLIEVYLEVSAGDFAPTFVDLRQRAEIIQGIPFISIEDLARFKQAYGRPKDLQDLELIEVYLAK